jgi:hypothetical protein
MLGRLANNLFQYAFARSLAEKYGVNFELDGSWFNNRTWPYVESLCRFPGVENGRAKVVRPFSFGSRALRKTTGKHHWEYLGAPIVREREKDHSFDQSLLESPSNSVVFGYFQSWRYFDHINQIIRKELSTSNMGLEMGLEHLSDELRNDHSVAIHVRRTDYVNNRNLVLHGMEYYQKAIEQIRRSTVNPKFYIFSDDPQWCTQNFHDSDMKVVIHNTPVTPLVDLHLMSLANHHIIANSSYSWWAAWLGKKQHQKVLMPPSWFREIVAPVSDKQCLGWEVIHY